jgi:hypothetical protein
MVQINKLHFSYHIYLYIFVVAFGLMEVWILIQNLYESKKRICVNLFFVLEWHYLKTKDVKVLEEVKPKCLGFSNFQWKIYNIFVKILSSQKIVKILIKCIVGIYLGMWCKSMLLVDFVKIKLNFIKNSEWHCMQLELNWIEFKFLNWIEFKYIWNSNSIE